MTPEQMKHAQLTSAAGATPGSGVGKIAPEMRELLVRQAAEAAAAQTGADIDAHNARIALRERHAAEARELGAQLAPPAAPDAPPAPTHERHERHAQHKGKGR